MDRTCRSAVVAETAFGSLRGMPTTTTIKLSVSTADQLRERAKADGVTIEREIAKLLRLDLQRRMGESLASQVLSDEDRDWLDLGARTVAKHAGR
jgi:hypothetical protein